MHAPLWALNLAHNASASLRQAAQFCRLRHELGNAFGADRAYGLIIKNAFFPDQPRQEINWQAIAFSVAIQEAARIRLKNRHRITQA